MSWFWQQSQFEKDATVLLTAIKNALLTPDGKGGYQPILPLINSKLDLINQQQQQLLKEIKDMNTAEQAAFDDVIKSVNDLTTAVTNETSAITTEGTASAAAVEEIKTLLAGITPQDDSAKIEATAQAIAAQVAIIGTSTANIQQSAANLQGAIPTPAPAPAPNEAGGQPA